MRPWARSLFDNARLFRIKLSPFSSFEFFCRCDVCLYVSLQKILHNEKSSQLLCELRV